VRGRTGYAYGPRDAPRLLIEICYVAAARDNVAFRLRILSIAKDDCFYDLDSNYTDVGSRREAAQGS
jgi:hypothetical protein